MNTNVTNNDDFYYKDQTISLDMTLEVIQKEIWWCSQHPDWVTPLEKEWYVKGLVQARYLIIEMAKLR